MPNYEIYSIPEREVSMKAIKYKINPSIGEEDSVELHKIKKGVRLQVQMAKLKGNPIARFDSKTKRPYLEFADGSRQYSDEL